MQRSEEDILSKAPIKVRLGDSEYDIKPLPILKARQWRTKLTETMKSIVSDMSVEQTATNIGPAMTAALVAFPDKVSDLVFAWSPDLPVEKVLAEATEEQMTIAYSKIMVLAYPFLAPLHLTLKVTKSQLS